ncbi:MAG TPA: hypothetical protein PLD33_08610 [Anaerolineales bacterium]|nr:hypothetical protein [Anaerolineales bacterium]HMV98239.1 hypothetical protein [Anaerolineales bacterium]HMX19293.1 hypothetical protein [Anaerolineales bacterium]HMZ42307.1 hypothetical protein [Anaerolineales bacterium]HNA54557.1 hypothetical protein [Anaerolineales bacterium]
MANSRNKFDTKDSLELGEHAENLFIVLAVRSGWKVSASSKDENIDDHWDYLIEKAGEVFKVEVKSQKRIRRGDKTEQTDFTWVELRNVRGKVGWLFGKADLIAFEKESSFLFVKRLDLLAVVNKKVNLVAKVRTPADAVYKIYIREGRKDKITLLPTSDVEEIKFMEWKKT